MKLGIQRHDPRTVRLGHQAGMDVFKPGEILVRAPCGGFLCRHHFQQPADFQIPDHRTGVRDIDGKAQHIHRGRRVQIRDIGAVTLPRLKNAHGLHDPHRLAQRVARQPQLLGEVALAG